MPHCVIGIQPSPDDSFTGRRSGTFSASGSCEITTPAACVDVFRTTPFSRCAKDSNSATVGSACCAARMSCDCAIASATEMLS